MLGAKISLIYAGGVGGAVLGFFGGLDIMIWVGNPIVGMILGGVVGYLVYKRSRFSKSSYYDPYA